MPSPPDRIMPAPGVVAREVGDEFFLIHPDNGSIHHLDHLGQAVWRLLSDGVSQAEVLRLLTDAFPDVSAKKIGADLDALLTELADYGLVRRTRRRVTRR